MKLSLRFAILASAFIARSSAFVAPRVNSFGLPTATVSSSLPATLVKSETETVTEAEVRSLFYLWNDALATGDSRIVASRYSSDPVLLATVSDTPRTDFDSVKDYFDSFLLTPPC